MMIILNFFFFFLLNDSDKDSLAFVWLEEMEAEAGTFLVISDSCGLWWVISLHYGFWQVSIKGCARASFLSDDFIWLSKQTAVPHQVQRALYLFFSSMKGKEIPKVKIVPVDCVCLTAVVVSTSCKTAGATAGKTHSFVLSPDGVPSWPNEWVQKPGPPNLRTCSHWSALGCLYPTCRSDGWYPKGVKWVRSELAQDMEVL